MLLIQLGTIVSMISSAIWFAGSLDKRIAILEISTHQVETDLDFYEKAQNERNEKQDLAASRFADRLNSRIQTLELSVCKRGT